MLLRNVPTHPTEAYASLQQVVGMVEFTCPAPAVMQSLKALRRVKKVSSCCQRDDDEGSSSLELRLAHCLCFGPGAPWAVPVLARPPRGYSVLLPNM